MLSATLIERRDVAKSLQKKVPAVQRRVEDTLARLAIKLTAHVKADKLSGQVLRNRTGRLRRSVNYRIDGRNTPQTQAAVGTNVVYARPHEYGGPVTVKEHLRMMTQAWGRPVKDPHPVTVKSHTVNYPLRSFLRSALKDMEDEIISGLRNSIKEEFK